MSRQNLVEHFFISCFSSWRQNDDDDDDDADCRVTGQLSSYRRVNDTSVDGLQYVRQ